MSNQINLRSQFKLKMELPNRWARVFASIKLRRNGMKKSCLHSVKQYVVVFSVSILIANEHGQIEHNHALNEKKETERVWVSGLQLTQIN